MTTARPAIFIDNDGTLVPAVAGNADPQRVDLTPGVGRALRMLQDSGFVLIVITNRPGAEGRLAASALVRLRERLEALLARHGVTLSGLYACPSAASADASEGAWPRPAPWLLRSVADEHRLDLERSWVVGGVLNDVEAGRRAGCRTALIDCGSETEWLLSRWRMPDLVADNLDTAARLIAEVERQAKPAAGERLH
jgi:D-glycero-D-manno-heptose 1,7-bisphosphate phosphatase